MGWERSLPPRRISITVHFIWNLNLYIFPSANEIGRMRIPTRFPYISKHYWNGKISDPLVKFIIFFSPFDDNIDFFFSSMDAMVNMFHIDMIAMMLCDREWMVNGRREIPWVRRLDTFYSPFHRLNINREQSWPGPIWISEHVKSQCIGLARAYSSMNWKWMCVMCINELLKTEYTTKRKMLNVQFYGNSKHTHICITRYSHCWGSLCC